MRSFWQARDEERRENSEVEPLRPAQAGQPPRPFLVRTSSSTRSPPKRTTAMMAKQPTTLAARYTNAPPPQNPERVARGKLQRLAGNDHRHLLQNDQQAEHHGRKRPQALHLLLHAMSVGQESQRRGRTAALSTLTMPANTSSAAATTMQPLAQHPILRAPPISPCGPFAVRIIVVSAAPHAGACAENEPVTEQAHAVARIPDDWRRCDEPSPHQSCPTSENPSLLPLHSGSGLQGMTRR